MINVICISNEPYLKGLRAGSFFNLTLGKRYQAEQQDGPLQGWLRVWDDFGEDCLYPPHMFDVCPET